MKLRVDEAWNEYSQTVLSKDAPEAQFIETRRAFYAGVSALFGLLMRDIGPEDGEPTEADVQILKDVLVELRAFNNRVKAGRA